MKPFAILLAVRDMERSVRFYREVFGMRVVNDFGANKALEGGIVLQTTETWETFIGKQEQDIVYRNNACEVATEVDDLDGFLERLYAYSGISFVHPLFEHRWGQRVIRFYDPDGHMIEVGENLDIVIKRFIDSGMSIKDTAVRMDIPESYVLDSLRRTAP